MSSGCKPKSQLSTVSTIGCMSFRCKLLTMGRSVTSTRVSPSSTSSSKRKPADNSWLKHCQLSRIWVGMERVWTACIWLGATGTSASFLAGLSVSSPRKIIYFHYLKKSFLDQSIQKIVYLFWKRKHWQALCKAGACIERALQVVAHVPPSLVCTRQQQRNSRKLLHIIRPAWGTVPMTGSWSVLPF